MEQRPATGIQPSDRVVPPVPPATAIVPGLPSTAPVPDINIDLDAIALPQGAVIRRAARMLATANYLNLGISLLLILLWLDATHDALAPVQGFGMVAWFVLDFVPALLVSSGAMRAKRLKDHGKALLGCRCMMYLGPQRMLMIGWLALLALEPARYHLLPLTLGVGCLVAAILNTAIGSIALTVFQRPDVREAFQ